MTYDPAKHHRRSIRLRGYDYAWAGTYFVTLCAQHRECLFGEVMGNKMRLNVAGQIVATIWQSIPRHFPGVTLEAWIIMPNHLHGIIVIGDQRRGEAVAYDSPASTTPRLAIASPNPPHPAPKKPEPLPTDASPRQDGTQPGSLSAIVQNFKSVSTRKINRIRNTPGGPVWQRNYYEHILRDEAALNRIRQYIGDNPRQWAEDENNPSRQ